VANKPISDSLLDQLQDEMREMARDLRAQSAAACEDDDAKLSRELAWMFDDVAGDRGLLVRFAFLLRKHSDKHGALAEITGATVSA
jgi:hypothetical protein